MLGTLYRPRLYARKKTERKSTQTTIINNNNRFPVCYTQYIKHFCHTSEEVEVQEGEVTSPKSFNSISKNMSLDLSSAFNH